MRQILKNNLLTVEIDTHGAELQSITDNRTGYQYLYQGDTPFWGRRSPVLFPIVGSVWDGKFRMDGKEYAMSQHGFARDREFEISDTASDDEAWFYLESDDNTLAAYPRRFRLEIGYNLTGERLTVMWRVTNLDEKEMSFQIGAHPAFNYPEFNPADKTHAYLMLDRKELLAQCITEKGCIGEKEMAISADTDNMIPVTADTFKGDALIFAAQGVRRVSMLDKDHRPYITLFFSSPAVGIWSPAPEAPFICIEPWYGRADRVGFDKDFSEREFVRTLHHGEKFDASYMICIDNL